MGVVSGHRTHSLRTHNIRAVFEEHTKNDSNQYKNLGRKGSLVARMAGLSVFFDTRNDIEIFYT